MNMRIIVTFVVIIFVCGCNNNKSSNNQKITQPIVQATDTTINQTLPVNSMVINENAVIFLFPDSIEISEMQAKYDEETYNEIVADLTWYPGLAGEVLDSVKIKNLHCNNEYIVFKSSDGRQTILKRKEIDGDMIVFNVEKDPLISSASQFRLNVVMDFLK